MVKFFKISVFIYLFLVINGCGTVSEKNNKVWYYGLKESFELKKSFNNEKALIYFYRQRKKTSYARVPVIKINEKFFNRIYDGSFWEVELDPGLYSIETWDKEPIYDASASVISINFSANQVYCIKFDYNGFFAPNGKLENISYDKCLEEIIYTKRVLPISEQEHFWDTGLLNER